MGCFGIQQTFEKGKQSPDRVFMAKVSILLNFRTDAEALVVHECGEYSRRLLHQLTGSKWLHAFRS